VTGALGFSHNTKNPDHLILPYGKVKPQDFEALQTIWQRPWCDDERADRAAFIEACREADPSEIIEAAKTWVAAADAPRYLPPLAKWLNGRGWLKVPSSRRQRTSGHRNGRKVDTAAMMLAMANQFELEEAGQ